MRRKVTKTLCILLALSLLPYVSASPEEYKFVINGVKSGDGMLKGELCEKLLATLVGFSAENFTPTDIRGPARLDRECTAEFSELKTEAVYYLFLLADTGQLGFKEETPDEIFYNLLRHFYFMLHPVPHFTLSYRIIFSTLDPYIPEPDNPVYEAVVETSVYVKLLGDSIVLSNASIVGGYGDGEKLNIIIQPGGGAGMFYLAVTNVSKVAGVTVNKTPTREYIHYSENKTLLLNNTVTGGVERYEVSVYSSPLTTSLTLEAAYSVEEAGVITFSTRLEAGEEIDLSNNTIVIERLLDGSWVKVAEAKTNQLGEATLSVINKDYNSYIARAVFLGTPLLQPSTSNTVTLEIYYFELLSLLQGNPLPLILLAIATALMIASLFILIRGYSRVRRR